MGLIVLILVGILPGMYALKMDASPEVVQEVTASAQELSGIFTKAANGAAQPASEADSTKVISAYLKSNGMLSADTYAALTQKSQDIAKTLNGLRTFQDLPQNPMSRLAHGILYRFFYHK
jgi:PiT family inorganic phosphate transporter